MRRAALQLHGDLGREPSDEELAVALNTTASQVSQTKLAVMFPVSLDARVDGDGARSYAETIADETATSPYEELADKTGLDVLRKTLGTLTRREKAVLRSRFGLHGKSPKNLKEIGNELCITDERVRQIQNAALKKLRRRLKNVENSPSPIVLPRLRRNRFPAACAWSALRG
jgi:DNA-directed RNA polymerase sigma subunit (sigma70/sigma32)